MEQTWKPTTAGILAIIAGVIGIILGLAATVAGGLAGGLADIPAMSLIIGAMAIPVLILGIIALVGGIFSLRRQKWGLALAGCICALLCVWFLAIPAIIFVVMGRSEFQ